MLNIRYDPISGWCEQCTPASRRTTPATAFILDRFRARDVVIGFQIVIVKQFFAGSDVA